MPERADQRLDLPKQSRNVFTLSSWPYICRIRCSNDVLIVLFREAVKPADLAVWPLTGAAHAVHSFDGYAEPGSKGRGRD